LSWKEKLKKTVKGVQFDTQRKLDQAEARRKERSEKRVTQQKEKRSKLLAQKKERLEEIKLDRQLAQEESKIRKLKGAKQEPGLFGASGDVPDLFGGGSKKKRKRNEFRI